jgi:ELWxxDGT repeat protein
MRSLIAATLTLTLAPAQNPPALLADLMPGPGSSHPSQFVVNAGTAVFRATDPLGPALWRSDGTPAGTARLAADPGAWVQALGRGLVCTNGNELRSIDLAGTVRTIFRASRPIFLQTAVRAADRLFFVADDGSLGGEIWSTDGTAAGTRALDFAAGAPGSSPFLLGVVGGHCAALVTHPATGRTLVTTDGTPTGTRTYAGLGPAHWFPEFAAGEGLFFIRTDDSTIYLGRAGSTSLSVAVPATVQPRTLLGVVGSAGATQRLVYLDDDPATGREPWVTDGTPAGTRLLADLWPGPNSMPPRFPVRSGGRLAFLGPNGAWVTDGTPAGTRLAMPLTSIHLAADSPWLERADGRLLATISVGPQRGLWELDLRTATARPLGVDFFAEVAVRGRLLGRGLDPAHGNEPRTWAIGALAVQSGNPCGAGLDAGELHGTLPQLGATWTLRGTRPAAAAIGLLAVGAVPATWLPFGAGCASAVELGGIGVLTALPQGPAWSWSLPLPAEPALRGITIALQAWFGPSGLAAGFELSNGLLVTFG